MNLNSSRTMVLLFSSLFCFFAVLVESRASPATTPSTSSSSLSSSSVLLPRRRSSFALPKKENNVFTHYPSYEENYLVDDDDKSVELTGTTKKGTTSSTTIIPTPALVLRGGAKIKPPASTEETSSDNNALAVLLNQLKIGFYFGLWYALNVIYNIVNKKVLNKLPAPLTVGAIQFGIGALYIIILWLVRLRKVPSLTKYGNKAVFDIGFFHCTGQLLSMVSLGAGPVSFTHIVKALEPFFSALVSAIMFNKWMKFQVYLTLVPVVGGVGYACLKERSFSWLAFTTAMGSNLTFALRAVLSKLAMTNSHNVGINITSTNMFGLATIAAFFISLPFAFVFERNTFGPLWEKAMTAVTNTIAETDTSSTTSNNSNLSAAAVAAAAATTTTTKTLDYDLIQGIILSGLFHYLNNEVMYLALGNVHPVTLAVGNTMKRVFIMVASIIVFRNPISVQAGIGSAVGILGVLLYSLTKQYYEGLEKKEAAAAAAAAATTKRGRKRLDNTRRGRS